MRKHLSEAVDYFCPINKSSRVLSHAGALQTCKNFWSNMTTTTGEQASCERAHYMLKKAPDWADFFTLLHKILHSTRGAVHSRISIVWAWWKAIKWRRRRMESQLKLISKSRRELNRQQIKPQPTRHAQLSCEAKKSIVNGCGYMMIGNYNFAIVLRISSSLSSYREKVEFASCWNIYNERALIKIHRIIHMSQSQNSFFSLHLTRQSNDAHLNQVSSQSSTPWVGKEGWIWRERCEWVNFRFRGFLALIRLKN